MIASHRIALNRIGHTQDDFDNLRTLCYDSTDVYVVCFSVVSPASFANVASRYSTKVAVCN